MAATSSETGKLGESAVSTQLLRVKNGLQFASFDPCSLGEKAELLDFVVRLKRDDHPFGPYFFLQVKTTQAPSEKGSIVTNFSYEEVQAAQALKAPVYIAAVDASNPKSEDIYIKPIYSDRKTGVYRVARKGLLSDDGVCMAVFKEVEMHFKDLKTEFKAPKGYADPSEEEVSHGQV
jgi:hypothetical protein